MDAAYSFTESIPDTMTLIELETYFSHNQK